MTSKAMRFPRISITLKGISIASTLLLALVLLANCIWYGGDIASASVLILEVIGWIVLGLAVEDGDFGLNWEQRQKIFAGARQLSIAASLAALFICIPSNNSVLVIGNSTSLSNWVFLRIPFVTTQSRVPFAFDGESKFFMSANGTRRGFLEINVQTTGLVLDTENPSIEQTLLRETAITPVDIGDQLKIRINEAVKAELATWPLARFDRAGGQFVLDNAVANRIIGSAHLNKLGVRWKDGMITITPQLHFNS